MMNQMSVTFRKLAAFSTRALGIELSPAGALGIVKRVAASLEGVYGEILASLPEQQWLNGDETGWKIMGRNGCICQARETPRSAHPHESHRPNPSGRMK